jgi:hypothetical protein
MKMRKKLLIVALMVTIAVSFAAYAWATYEGAHTEKDQEASIDVTEFKAVVNGMKNVDVNVCVDVGDGLTEEEAELIAGTTFILVMGDRVTDRLDTLIFNDAEMEAHYTWGHDENDMGHVFHMNVDLSTLQITVDHCF